MSAHDTVLARPRPANTVADVQSIFQFPATVSPDLRRIALVGTYVPRKCGIATFGCDIVDKLAEFHPNIQVDVYALDDPRAPLASWEFGHGRASGRFCHKCRRQRRPFAPRPKARFSDVFMPPREPRTVANGWQTDCSMQYACQFMMM